MARQGVWPAISILSWLTLPAGARAFRAVFWAGGVLPAGRRRRHRFVLGVWLAIWFGPFFIGKVGAVRFASWLFTPAHFARSCALMVMALLVWRAWPAVFKASAPGHFPGCGQVPSKPAGRTPHAPDKSGVTLRFWGISANGIFAFLVFPANARFRR